MAINNVNIKIHVNSKYSFLVKPTEILVKKPLDVYCSDFNCYTLFEICKKFFPGILEYLKQINNLDIYKLFDFLISSCPNKSPLEILNYIIKADVDEIYIIDSASNEFLQKQIQESSCIMNDNVPVFFIDNYSLYTISLLKKQLNVKYFAVYVKSQNKIIKFDKNFNMIVEDDISIDKVDSLIRGLSLSKLQREFNKIYNKQLKDLCQENYFRSEFRRFKEAIADRIMEIFFTLDDFIIDEENNFELSSFFDFIIDPKKMDKFLKENSIDKSKYKFLNLK